MMVIFDKSITLSEKMNEYDKESLKAFAVDLGLRKLSQLKKADLVAKIVEKLLDPETMFYRASILTDKEIAVFEKGFEPNRICFEIMQLRLDVPFEKIGYVN